MRLTKAVGFSCIVVALGLTAVRVPAAIQAPTPGQPIPFGRPAPSLGRRLPPIPTDPSGQPLPAPTQ